jgi:hypothetical protein
MFLDEALHEPVRMIVARVPAQPELLARARARGLEQLGLELHVEKLVVEPLVDEDLAVDAPTRVEQRAIPESPRYGLTPADGVHTPAGTLALLLTLADPDAAGNYGVRDTADRILPPIEPLPAPRD